MPSTTIEVRRAYSLDEEVALVEAVQTALRQALRLPEWDRNVRLVVHQPHRFAAPSNRAQPDRYTIVSIDMFAGRTLDTKRALYRAICERLAPCGIPPDHVLILLREIPRESWGVRGGQAASDVELGFEVEI
ncbi:MAG TPA: tautomerase family protein [Kofleriaceae bacterium]|nr:tautomerase family protein [Kofleriaceae bacterium]